MAAFVLFGGLLTISNAISDPWSSILIGGVPISDPSISQSPTLDLSMPLRQAAEKAGIFVGAALNYYHLQQDSQYAQVGGEQYNLMTAENGCKFGSTEPNYNQFDFTQCDYDYNYAKSKNMTFRGMCVSSMHAIFYTCTHN